MGGGRGWLAGDTDGLAGWVTVGVVSQPAADAERYRCACAGRGDGYQCVLDWERSSSNVKAQSGPTSEPLQNILTNDKRKIVEISLIELSQKYKVWIDERARGAPGIFVYGVQKLRALGGRGNPITAL